jgi:hypothetical protein
VEESEVSGSVELADALKKISHRYFAHLNLYIPINSTPTPSHLLNTPYPIFINNNKAAVTP